MKLIQILYFIYLINIVCSVQFIKRIAKIDPSNTVNQAQIDQSNQPQLGATQNQDQTNNNQPQLDATQNLAQTSYNQPQVGATQNPAQTSNNQPQLDATQNLAQTSNNQPQLDATQNLAQTSNNQPQVGDTQNLALTSNNQPQLGATQNLAQTGDNQPQVGAIQNLAQTNNDQTPSLGNLNTNGGDQSLNNPSQATNSVNQVSASSTQNKNKIPESPELQKWRSIVNDYVILFQQARLEQHKKIAPKFQDQPDQMPSDDQPKKLSESKQIKKRRALFYIAEPYRNCIFPVHDINAMGYCEQTFPKKYLNKQIDCQYMMCINCCNHMKLVFKNVVATDKSKVTELLGLKGNDGDQLIDHVYNRNAIQKCKSSCLLEYPSEHLSLDTAPLDPTLGQNSSNPAKTCSDIKFNNPIAPTGSYFIVDKNNQPVQAYCDMTSQKGGWTLFFNYNHVAQDQTKLTPNILPVDANSSSHINLKDFNIDNNDVQELKFFCTTTDNTSQISSYYSFNTKNQDIINVSISGNQAILKTDSFSFDNKQIIPNSFDNATVSQNLKVVKVGSDQNGGLFQSLFETETGRWTVRGGGQPIWECGNKLNGTNGNAYSTIHQIYFRGNPPSQEYQIQRYKNKHNSSKNDSSTPNPNPPISTPQSSNQSKLNPSTALPSTTASPSPTTQQAPQALQAPATTGPHKPNLPWQCIFYTYSKANQGIMLRTNKNGDVECYDDGSHNCIRFKDVNDCKNYINTVPANAKVLTCGDMHKQLFQVTGYDMPKDPNNQHMCNSFVDPARFKQYDITLNTGFLQ